MTLVRYRPIESWPGALTAEREVSRFTARIGDTLRVLDREMDALGATEAVVQLALPERSFRADGDLRSDARQPDHPGVILSFEAPTLGPLRYWTDRFSAARVYENGRWRDVPGWHDNLRAIALGLEALRRVERYGIAERGEQYAGWKQLGAGVPLGPPAPMTVDEAARVIAVGAGLNLADADDIADTDVLAYFYRRASKRHHPDTGGDPDLFRRITEARNLLADHLKGTAA